MYKTHLFICTASPEKPGKCGHKNSEALRRELKEVCKHEFGKDVRINASGCLGHCERGINAVIYPSGKWFHELTDKDGAQLLEAVRADMAGKKES
jgi:predicted metal-binding protein